MNTQPTPAGYVAWRRHPDGFVGASAGMTPPRGWSHRDRDGDGLVQVTFETLLTTDDWDAARIRIKAERIAAQMNHDIDPIGEAADSNWDTGWDPRGVFGTKPRPSTQTTP